MTNTSNIGMASIKQERETITESSLKSMKTKAKKECVMSTETTFIEDENKRKCSK